jgi:hypothetical protein
MLKFLLGDCASVLPMVVLGGGVAFFLLVVLYLVTDGRTAHRRRMEALPCEGDHHA